MTFSVESCKMQVATYTFTCQNINQQPIATTQVNKWLLLCQGLHRSVLFPQNLNTTLGYSKVAEYSNTAPISTVYYINTVFQKRDYVFDDKLHQNCPFATIFGTLITTVEQYRPSTGVFIFLPHLFCAPWKTVET